MISDATGLIRTDLMSALRKAAHVRLGDHVAPEAMAVPFVGSTASSRRIWPSTGMTGSSSRIVDTTRRYGVSMKPYGLILPYVASEPMRPMFGPSGVSIGQMRPYGTGGRHGRRIRPGRGGETAGSEGREATLVVNSASGLVGP
jgi:hypothetical protein